MPELARIAEQVNSCNASIHQSRIGLTLLLFGIGRLVVTRPALCTSMARCSCRGISDRPAFGEILAEASRDWLWWRICQKAWLRGLAKIAVVILVEWASIDLNSVSRSFLYAGELTGQNRIFGYASVFVDVGSGTMPTSFSFFVSRCSTCKARSRRGGLRHLTS